MQDRAVSALFVGGLSDGQRMMIPNVYFYEFAIRDETSPEKLMADLTKPITKDEAMPTRRIQHYKSVSERGGTRIFVPTEGDIEEHLEAHLERLERGKLKKNQVRFLLTDRALAESRIPIPHIRQATKMFVSRLGRYGCNWKTRPEGKHGLEIIVTREEVQTSFTYWKQNYGTDFGGGYDYAYSEYAEAMRQAMNAAAMNTAGVNLDKATIDALRRSMGL